jgi:hypothetical protein
MKILIFYVKKNICRKIHTLLLKRYFKNINGIYKILMVFIL